MEQAAVPVPTNLWALVEQQAADRPDGLLAIDEHGHTLTFGELRTRAERVAAAGRVTGYWRGAPDLAVEVISPNDLYTEVDEKIAEWLAHGTQMVLVVNPRRRVVVVHRPDAPPRTLTEQDVLSGEDVLPGWSLPVRDLFAGTRR